MIQFTTRPLSERNWEIIAPVLFVALGQRRPANREFLDAVFSVLNTGKTWRQLDGVHGSWNTIYVKFRRWAAAGVWDGLLPVLVELGLTRDWQCAFEESQGFPTTTRIVVEQARVLGLGQVPGQTIAEQVEEWEAFATGRKGPIKARNSMTFAV